MSHLARVPRAYANTWVTRLNPSSENIKWPLCSPLTSSGEQALCLGLFFMAGSADLLLVERDTHAAGVVNPAAQDEGVKRGRGVQRPARTLHLFCANRPGNHPISRVTSLTPTAPHSHLLPLICQEVLLPAGILAMLKLTG